MKKKNWILKNFHNNFIHFSFLDYQRNKIVKFKQKNIKKCFFFLDTAILTPLNQTVKAINEIALERFCGRTHVFQSIDEAVDADLSLYPQEFLNSLMPTGMPPHELQLKKGAPVMLLKTLDRDQKLLNGTRLIILEIGNKVLLCRNLITNKNCFIPRIYNVNNDGTFPFVLRRLQFPIRLCFAMTINKAQGQTFEQVGIYLPAPVFAHGQLYVAMSRVGHENKCLFFILDEYGKRTNKTKNIVYKEALLNWKEF